MNLLACVDHPSRRANPLQDIPVLRITKIRETLSSATLRVEGRVASEWVSVLEAESLRWLGEKRTVVLDFSDVSFIDGRGVETLRRIHSKHLRIVNCPPLLAELLNGEEW